MFSWIRAGGSCQPDERRASGSGAKGASHGARKESEATMSSGNLANLVNEWISSRGERVALRYRNGAAWREMTWRDLGDKVLAAATALVELGLPAGGRVAIYSHNRPEWSIADLATVLAGGVSVPIYPTTTAAQAAYILRDSAASVVFAGGVEQLERLRSTGVELKVVALDPALPLLGDPAVMSFPDFLALGARSDRPVELAARRAALAGDDLVTLIYTSGTTGEPKGVMLTHGNFLECFRIHDLRLSVGEDDSSLCFLPLSHVFERGWTYYAFHKGMVNNVLDDATKVVEALQQVRPTVMCAVPRFYEKVHATVLNRVQAAPAARRRLFHWAVRVGRAAGARRKDRLPLSPWLRLRWSLADALVLSKLRAVVGGRIRFMPCAGAPLAREIEEFFWAVGIRILCGYGLTETTATVSCHEDAHFRFGTVGRPMPGVEVRIGDEGEIQVRGGTVMKGYHGKPEATAEVFVDGWFRTGDAGTLDEEGLLSVTERLKDLIKTSGGKYVAPQAIESRLGTERLIEQVAVIGDRRRFVSALVVPSFPALEEWAAARDVPVRDREALIAEPEVVALYRDAIERHNADLARYEQVRRFTLLPREFTVEGGEITPTLKIRRSRVAEKYAGLIEAMYAE
ncbi:MAG: AMP-dependent synthetase/ligase [Acidobacteriota bacterium]